MEIFSSWAGIDRFNAEDAAALIVGENARTSGYVRTLSGPVYESMERSYNEARSQFHPAYEDTYPPVVFLESIDLCWYKEDPLPGTRRLIEEWLSDKTKSGFELQSFTRQEMARWLTAVGVRSVYKFDPGQPGAPQDSPGRWPWGSHHTELLGHLEAAALKWWILYEPSDPTTAPTNETVIAWLKTERKVSGQMAKAIATMLRPNGLRSGPRK